MAFKVTFDLKFEICGLKNLRYHVPLASKGLHLLDERQEAQNLFLVIVATWWLKRLSMASEVNSDLKFESSGFKDLYPHVSVASQGLQKLNDTPGSGYMGYGFALQNLTI